MKVVLSLLSVCAFSYAGNLVLTGDDSKIIFQGDDGVEQAVWDATSLAEMATKISALETKNVEYDTNIATLASKNVEYDTKFTETDSILDKLTIGSINNPASDPMDLRAELSGWYYLDVPGFEKKQVYVDNDRNGGAWVLAATVRVSSCQAHWNTGEVGLDAGKGPSKDSASTQKLSDAWMNALRAQSSYSGTTGLWMEATTMNKNNFISSAATIDSVDSVENQDARTHIATSYEGGLSNRDPNSGTRGLGDHHTNAAYFSYQRHPEGGDNCGFKSDAAGESDGYLWIK